MRIFNNDYWLAWKLNHGLAKRGQSNAPCQPVGLVAKLLYLVYYKRLDDAKFKAAEFEEKPEGGKLYKVTIGGRIGPTGKL